MKTGLEQESVPDIESWPGASGGLKPLRSTVNSEIDRNPLASVTQVRKLIEKAVFRNCALKTFSSARPCGVILFFTVGLLFVLWILKLK